MQTVCLKKREQEHLFALAVQSLDSLAVEKPMQDRERNLSQASRNVIRFEQESKMNKKITNKR